MKLLFVFIGLLISFCVYSLNSAFIIDLSNLKRAKFQKISINNTKILELAELSAEKIKSKPRLFEKVLGLGDNSSSFDFPVNKWRALQSSGLYQNLTAKFYERNGVLSLNISGYELPSVKISPEIEMKASLKNPEIVGGILYEDNNFLGLGQKFEFLFTKSESSDHSSFNLDPHINIKWTDLHIGENSKVSTYIDLSQKPQDSLEIMPIFAQKQLNAQELLDLKMSKKPIITTNKIGAIFKSTHFFDNENSKDKMKQIDFSLEPFINNFGDFSNKSRHIGQIRGADFNFKYFNPVINYNLYKLYIILLYLAYFDVNLFLFLEWEFIFSFTF